MQQSMNSGAASSEPVPPRFDLVKKGAKVLWLYRDRVETGSVLSVENGNAHLVWLEGYKSRNDTVRVEDLLSVHCPTAPHMSIFPFSGNGYILPAGAAWLEQHPESEVQRLR